MTRRRPRQGFFRPCVGSRGVAAWTALAAVWLLTPGTAAAQSADLAPMTAPSVTATATPVTVEAVESLLKQVETASELDKETRAKITERYTAALQELKRIETVGAAAAKLQAEAKSAAERAAAVRAETAGLPSQPTADVSASQTPAQLKSDLAGREAALSTLKATQKDREAERKARPERMAAIRKEQAQADLKRADLKLQAEAAAPEGESPALTQAKRFESEARRTAFEQTLPALDHELAKYAAEEAVELPAAVAELLKAKIKREETAIRLLTEEINRRSREEAERQIVAARLQELIAHPLLKPLAEQNRLDAEEVSRLTTKLEGIVREAEQTATQLDEQRQRFATTKEKVEKIGLTRPIGMMLRQQRGGFPDLAERERQQQVRQELSDQARMLAWDYAERLKEVPTAAAYVETASARQPLPAEERSEVEDSAGPLLAKRRAVLAELERLSDDYFNKLVDLHSTEEQYLEDARDYLLFINERILWTRSAELLTPQAVRDDRATRNRLTAPVHWRAVAETLTSDPTQNPFAFWATLATVLALFYVRLRIRPRVRALGEAAAKRGFLRYAPTSQAALLTVMSAATAPAAVMFLSWRLAEGAEPTGFVRSVAATLQCIAAFLFPVELFREACRHFGLAESHFAWPSRMIRELRHLMTWLKWLGVPLLFAAVLAHQHAPLSGGTATERVLFVVGMIGAAGLVHRALSSRSELVRAMVTERPDGPFAHFQILWYAAALAVPTGLATLSVLGYHYSAVQLADRLLLTLWLAPAAAILRAMATRWVILSRRRLLLDQAYQRRAAAVAAAEENPDGVPAKPPVVEETDIARTTAQTRKIIHAALLGLTACGLWTIWADVLPAFSLLDRELWTVAASPTADAASDAGDAAPSMIPGTGSVGGAPASGPSSPNGLVPVTTLDLALAILVAVFTTLAVRNLPGLMEMSVLNRLPLDNATRYAAVRLVCYGIIIVGVLAGSKLLGLRWHNVQWLAAALTVGLGFGLQEVFANFVSGLIILFERPIRVGDIVTIDEVTGSVSKIRMRATTITNWDRKEFLVPNKEFITGRLMNWTLSDAVNRLTVPVGVAYGSDTDQARRILLEICDEHPLLLKDPPPVASFEGFGDSTLNLVLRCFLPNLEARLQTITDLHTRIDQRFREAKIEIAFPQRDLHVRSIEGMALPFPVVASRPERQPKAA